MIVANFYHLKNTNGLFYYGVDYLGEDLSKVRRVLVRPSMQEAALRALPGAEIVTCTFVQLLREVAGAARRGDFIYTPSSHPLPFISRQMIVVHDVFPFFGSKGKIKELLVRLSLATSGCRVGYINNSDARAFVGKLGASLKGLFAPNKFPMPAQMAPVMSHQGGPLSVGLFGTDSSKKNYAELFTEVLAQSGGGRVRFLLYGHRTPYFETLMREFPNIDMQLLESDKFTLSRFLSQVQVIVSVANHEGFGRPIAAALLASIPCLLVQHPVFVEFFQGGAQFRANIPDVVDHMLELALAPSIQHVSYSPPAAVVDGYRNAVAYLQAQAAEF
jgi:hypothetical protein